MSSSESTGDRLDPPVAGWPAWRADMAAAKQQAGVTYEKIASSVHSNVDTVRNYFTGRSNPPIELLAGLARSVDREPEELLVPLGLLDPRYASTVVEIVRLRYEVQELRSLLGASTAAATSVAAAALEAGCGVAVWPAEEGQRFGSVGVGHRVTVVPRFVGDAVPTAVLERIRAAGGVRPRHSGRRAEMQYLRPEGRDDYELWSLPTLTAPRPVPRLPRPGFPASVVVFSLTLTAGPNDAASMLAYALRYGFASTRDARGLLVGGRGEAAELNRDRNRAARLILRDPRLRQQTVWSHFGVPVVDPSSGQQLEPFAPAELAAGPEGRPLLVWLRESEQLLSLHRERSDTRFDESELLAFQDQIADALSSSGAESIEISVDLPEPGTPRRDGLIDRAISVTADLVHRLDSSNPGFAQEVVEDSTVPKVLRAAVAAAYSSSPPSSSSSR